MPARYADYLAKARKSGDDTAFRHYWEMCDPVALRDGLRSGDVFVPGSRRYADPVTYLYTPEQWQPRLAEFCQLVRKPRRGGRGPRPGEGRAAPGPHGPGGDPREQLPAR